LILAKVIIIKFSGGSSPLCMFNNV